MYPIPSNFSFSALPMLSNIVIYIQSMFKVEKVTFLQQSSHFKFHCLAELLRFSMGNDTLVINLIALSRFDAGVVHACSLTATQI